MTERIFINKDSSGNPFDIGGTFRANISKVQAGEVVSFGKNHLRRILAEAKELPPNEHWIIKTYDDHVTVEKKSTGQTA